MRQICSFFLSFFFLLFRVYADLIRISFLTTILVCFEEKSICKKNLWEVHFSNSTEL